MDYQKREAEQALTQLFYKFIDAGLHGRFEEALALMIENYMGVGMGEQGIVHGKKEARHILQDGYIPEKGTTIEFSIENFTINLLSQDVAVLFGEVIIINTPLDGEPMCSGLVQTVNALRIDGDWRIAFTHASPTILTEESVKAYPIRFLDQTLTTLRAGLQAEGAPHLDPLTGILNREGLERRAAELLQEYTPKHNTALFMIDLDDFKQINDRLGHQTGDAVLQQVASALRNTFRACDAVGRMGGDEFMVLLTGDLSAKFLEKKADELLNTMRLRMNGSHEVPISVSIGVAYGRARSTFDKLYRIADIALYSAKKAGKCRYHLINSDTNVQHGYNGSGTNLLSLQTLLDYTDGKEILESKTPYEALLENIPGGVVMFEFTADRVKRTCCNDWFSNLLGYTDKEIAAQLADNSLALVHPDDVPMVQRAIQAVQDGADSNNMIYRLRHKDGSYSHINQMVTVTERNSGSIILYGIEADVDEAVRLKQEVEESKRELETLLNTIPGGVISITLTDRVLLTHRNQWMSRFLGYSPQELDKIENGNGLMLVHPDDMPLMGKAIETLRAGAKEVDIVYRLLGKDGSYRHVRISASLTERRPDKLLYYGVVTDVNEMTHVQKALEHSNRKLETLLSALPGGIAVFEIGDTLKVSQYGTWALNFSGYDSNEEIELVRQGAQLSTIWPEDVHRAREALRQVKEDGTDQLFLSIRLKCKDGTPKWVDIHGSVIERTAEKATLYVIYTESPLNE